MRSESKRVKLMARVKELESQIAVTRIALRKLEKDNEDANGALRVDVLFKRSEFNMQERELAEVRGCDVLFASARFLCRRLSCIGKLSATHGYRFLCDDVASLVVPTQVNRLLHEANQQEESNWAAVMKPVLATDMASGKVQQQGFQAVSSAAENSCLRFYLTSKELLEAQKRRHRHMVHEVALTLDERMKQLQVCVARQRWLSLLSHGFPGGLSCRHARWCSCSVFTSVVWTPRQLQRRHTQRWHI